MAEHANNSSSRDGHPLVRLRLLLDRLDRTDEELSKMIPRSEGIKGAMNLILMTTDEMLVDLRVLRKSIKSNTYSTFTEKKIR